MSGTIVSCNAPYGEGGLGHALAAVVEDERASGSLAGYFCLRAKPGDTAGREVDLRRYRWITRGMLRAASHGWRDVAACELFDRAVAGRLPRADRVFAFTGRARATFERGRRLGASLVLEASNSHVAHLRRQQQLAERISRIERGWMTPLHARKTLAEYASADTIVVLSEYVRQSFLAAGIPERRLRRRVQPIAARFAPPARRPPSDRFTIVYVGRFDILKGITVLLDAFSAFADADATLVLVGAPATAAMARYVELRRHADPRIEVRQGDPLPALHAADVLVHAAFEDGLAIAPLEALACGVPVIVSEDTGMKEFVVPGRNGFIVPTGDVSAIVERLRFVRAHAMRDALTPLSLVAAAAVSA